VTEISESEVFDVVIVATKHYQAAEAVAQYFPKAPSATFLLFTANWNGIDEIAGLLPRSSMQWGYAQATGGFDSRGALVATMNPEVRIGILDGGDSDKYKRVCELFESADFKLDIKQNILQWLWIHHAVNAGGIGLCLWAGEIRKATGSPKMLRLGMLAVQDALKVVRVRGVDDSETRFATQRLNFQPLLAYLGLQFASRFTEKGRRLLGSGHFDNNPEEMKRYFNDVLTTGEQFGLDLPPLTVFRNGIDRPSGK
jgi:2-dehydropantoate 2-reductase